MSLGHYRDYKIARCDECFWSFAVPKDEVVTECPEPDCRSHHISEDSTTRYYDLNSGDELWADWIDEKRGLNYVIIRHTPPITVRGEPQEYTVGLAVQKQGGR